MKLYRAKHCDGARLSWHASKRAAEKALREDETSPALCFPEEVEQVAVPTDRAGLLDWLNRHVSSEVQP
jgi:hypothetical protein